MARPLLHRLEAFLRVVDHQNLTLRAKVVQAMALTDEDDPCVACDDAHKQGWYDAGFSEAERIAFCQLLGCLPPNEG